MVKRKTREEFIRQAIEVHGNKYNYDKVVYINATTNVIITCNGCKKDFGQTPHVHLDKNGCKPCGIKNRAILHTKTQEQFLKDAKEKHGNRYNYDKAIYVNALTKVIITCKIHGDYEQDPCAHTGEQAHGCPECGLESAGLLHRKSQEQFIEDARKIHGDRYNYDKVVYITCMDEVLIGCDIHGYFNQVPSYHLDRHGCRECAQASRDMIKTKTLEEFIKEAREIHGNKYNYDKVVYVTRDTKVIITCDIHGDYDQTPASHICNKSGCYECGIFAIYISRLKSQEQFIEEAVEKHGGRYKYDRVIYIDGKTDVLIKCEDHGYYEQSPANHLRGCGCPRCIHKTEAKCIKYLENLCNDKLMKKRPKWLERLELDGYNRKLKLAIEYNGEQHHIYVPHYHRNGISDLYEIQERDRRKKELCQTHNVYLIVVPYFIDNKEEYIINEYKLYLENKVV